MNERIKRIQYTTIFIERMRLEKTCPKTGTGFYRQQKRDKDDEGNKQKINNNGHTKNDKRNENCKFDRCFILYFLVLSKHIKCWTHYTKWCDLKEIGVGWNQPNELKHSESIGKLSPHHYYHLTCEHFWVKSVPRINYVNTCLFSNIFVSLFLFFCIFLSV